MKLISYSPPGAAQNTPHREGRKAKVPRQSTSGKKRSQRATGRR